MNKIRIWESHSYNNKVNTYFTLVHYLINENIKISDITIKSNTRKQIEKLK